MKKRNLFLPIGIIVLSIYLFSGCTSNIESTPQLTMKTTTFVGDAKTEVLSVLELGDYYETELSLFTDKETDVKYYAVQNDVVEGKFVNDVFNWTISELVDNTGETMEFETPTDFLNFLASKGYEMIEQKKGKYNINYTFKKKS